MSPRYVFTGSFFPLESPVLCPEAWIQFSVLEVSSLFLAFLFSLCVVRGFPQSFFATCFKSAGRPD